MRLTGKKPGRMHRNRNRKKQDEHRDPQGKPKLYWTRSQLLKWGRRVGVPFKNMQALILNRYLARKAASIRAKQNEATNRRKYQGQPDRGDND